MRSGEAAALYEMVKGDTVAGWLWVTLRLRAASLPGGVNTTQRQLAEDLSVTRWAVSAAVLKLVGLGILDVVSGPAGTSFIPKWPAGQPSFQPTFQPGNTLGSNGYGEISASSPTNFPTKTDREESRERSGSASDCQPLPESRAAVGQVHSQITKDMHKHEYENTRESEGAAQAIPGLDDWPPPAEPSDGFVLGLADEASAPIGDRPKKARVRKPKAAGPSATGVPSNGANLVWDSSHPLSAALGHLSRTDALRTKFEAQGEIKMLEELMSRYVITIPEMEEICFQFKNWVNDKGSKSPRGTLVTFCRNHVKWRTDSGAPKTRNDYQREMKKGMLDGIMD